MAKNAMEPASLMSPQEALHELERLTRIFGVFSTGQQILQAMLAAESHKAALEKASADLAATIESQKADLAALKEEQEKSQAGWDEELDAHVVATEAAINAKKGEYTLELETLTAQIQSIKGELLETKTAGQQVIDKQSRQLVTLKKQADEAETRLKSAQDALASIKAGL